MSSFLRAEEPAAEKPAPASEEKPIAEVLGKPIYLKDLHVDESDKSPLRDYFAIAGLIFGPLIDKYVKDQGLEATAEEIKEQENWSDLLNVEIAKRFPDIKAPPPMTAEDKAGMQSFYKHIVERWKFNKAVYEKYGGRVIFQQAGIEPLDAHLKWLEDQEKAGNFKIDDPYWRAAFGEYSKSKYHRIDVIDGPEPFKTPPWRTKPLQTK
jgi:hypothetical protein